MRRLASHIILTALLTAVLSLRAGAQDSYLDRIEWLPGEMVIGVDSADGSRTAVLDMVLRWKDRPWAAPQHTVCIVPVLYGQDSTMAFSFAPIYIDGRIRSRALEREAVLDRRQVHREEGSFVVEVGRKAPLAVRYTESLPYNAAMLDGYVVLYETVHGCADCLEGTDSLRLADVLPRYVPDWAAPGFMQSPDGDNKSRERRHRADLKFKVNLSGIDPAYGDNAEALEGIVESIHTAMNDSIYTVRAVRFMGYASPEGPERFNTALSARRAASLADHIRSMDTSLPDSLFIVEGGAEDWDGFFAAVAGHSALAGNETVARVMALLTDSNRDSCERILRADHRHYNVLRTDILPPLRRTEYVIEYDIRNFTPEEAERLWREHPQWLSINEFYSVAQLYGEDDPRYVEVLLAAARTYPADVAATHNAAMALHRAGMTTEAVSLLSGRYEPGLLNTLGIIYAGEEMFPEARAAFNMAAASGYADAQTNLEQLDRVEEQL